MAPLHRALSSGTSEPPRVRIASLEELVRRSIDATSTIHPCLFATLTSLPRLSSVLSHRDPSRVHTMAPSVAVDFSATTPLSAAQRVTLRRRFFHIIDHYGKSRSQTGKQRPYNPVQLISCTYDYAISEESKDTFLRAFFQSMSLSIDVQNDNNLDAFRASFFGFADHLIDNFFLPRKTQRPAP